jgi:predicted alpha/beta hydrolase
VRARSVVVLPGLGNNSKDYAGLAEQLQQRGLHVEVAPVARLDWARNAAGLRYREYWQGTLAPRPTVDWYLQRVGAALEAAKRATDGAPVTLLCHSAGGWLGRCGGGRLRAAGDAGGLGSATAWARLRTDDRGWLRLPAGCSCWTLTAPASTSLCRWGRLSCRPPTA